jgi:cytochrome c oxidase cbb3-type subunit 2
MPYRLKPHIELLIAADQAGVLWHHYRCPAASGSHVRGPYIPWLNEAQRESWLRNNLIEEIDAEPVPTPQPEPVELVPVPCAEIVDEAVRDLDRLGVPADSGAPTCRQRLRESGAHYANDAIALAVKTRRARAALPETATP